MDRVGVFKVATAAGISDKGFRGRTGSVRAAVPDQGQQVFDGAGAQLIDRKGDGCEHRRNTSAVRRVVAPGDGDVIGYTVSCGKGGGEKHECEPVIVADYGPGRPRPAEKGQRLIYIVVLIVAVVNIVFIRHFTLLFQSFPVITFSYI